MHKLFLLLAVLSLLMTSPAQARGEKQQATLPVPVVAYFSPLGEVSSFRQVVARFSEPIVN